jgi:hypothetical protein
VNLLYLSVTQLDRQEIRDITVSLSEKISRNDVAGAIAAQVRPLAATIASVEKSLNVQDTTQRRTEEEFHQTTRSLKAAHDKLINSGILDFVQHNTLNELKVEEMIRDAFREKKHNELHQQDVESMLANNTDYYLKQLNLMGESIRLEMSSILREEVEREKTEWKTGFVQQSRSLTEVR